jgi:hypothetical protein
MDPPPVARVIFVDGGKEADCTPLSGLESGGWCRLLAMRASARFLRNSFSTCVRTGSAISRIWKSRSDRSRQHAPRAQAIVRTGGEGSAVGGHLRPGACLRAACPRGAAVMPVAPVPMGWRDRSPGARRTQASRAVWCAWATQARVVPRRAWMPWSHRLRASVVPCTRGMTARAPGRRRVRRDVGPPGLMPREVGVPPRACGRGPRPSQAASWRPFLHVGASPTAAPHAVAVSGPRPSIWASRWQASRGSNAC